MPNRYMVFNSRDTETQNGVPGRNSYRGVQMEVVRRVRGNATAPWNTEGQIEYKLKDKGYADTYDVV